MWKKEEKKNCSKAKLKTVALCARSLWAEVITKWQEGFFLFVSGCVRGVGGPGGGGGGAVYKGAGDSRYKYCKKTKQKPE